MKKVSVVTCTYGRRDLLAEAIKSFVSQNYERKEMIIINDCPGQKLHCPVRGVRIINCDKRMKTLGAKRAFALHFAKGDLVTHLDDDDLLLPWHISNLVAKWEPGLDCVVNSTRWKMTGDEIELKESESWINSLITMEALKRFGFRKDISIGEDSDLKKRMIEEEAEYLVRDSGMRASYVIRRFPERFQISRGWKAGMRGEEEEKIFEEAKDQGDLTPGEFDVKAEWKEDYIRKIQNAAHILAGGDE